ncbi:hypothetical protein [Leptospira borgpetersenii]|uniref:hypothetical protein n=1 Tax=Leptospira borgpetersenii TaxID=174 RepID=UPI00187F17E5|nr:hypothetical protein [Leptospira borgpetersenii]MBE8163889.1 hypothetical protein [Leptospira borgpetersenii serovar Ballum]MBE8169275.1 hypothetical protein [Leptospira borgpetersenii serovar Ballum]MBE8195333.1 hypothetical protein [Leptospira borgpetersenii serovar Ballum]MBE8208550.1 hypothetical protein [Leptospira borgpetersenii serovar Ballum]MBE8211885.1 hypothetical protein [Leptospira borgpetersenii serovar Ballum]
MIQFTKIFSKTKRDVWLQSGKIISFFQPILWWKEILFSVIKLREGFGINPEKFILFECNDSVYDL